MTWTTKTRQLSINYFAAAGLNNIILTISSLSNQGHLAPCTVDYVATILSFQTLTRNLTRATLLLVPFLVMSKLYMCLFYVHVYTFYYSTL